MKKNLIFLLAFVIVWAFIAFMCYMLSLMFGRDWFADWREYVIIGFAGAMAGVFGPVLAAWIGKMFKERP